MGSKSTEFLGSRPAVQPFSTGLKVWMSVLTFGMVAFRRAISVGLDRAARAKEYIRNSETL